MPPGRASRVISNPQRGSAKQSPFAVMAVVLPRRAFTIPLAGRAGWGTAGEGQLLGPELGACRPGLLPLFLLHVAATETPGRPGATARGLESQNHCWRGGGGVSGRNRGFRGIKPQLVQILNPQHLSSLCLNSCRDRELTTTHRS